MRDLRVGLPRDSAEIGRECKAKAGVETFEIECLGLGLTQRGRRIAA